MKKRVKKHEESINNLLDIKIKLKPYSTDIVIDNQCCKYRPDRVYHLGTHIVIVEIDEKQHKSYNNCGYTKEEKIKGENKRMFSISQSFDGLSVIFIRYNPDNYKSESVPFTTMQKLDYLARYIQEFDFDEMETGLYVKYLFYDMFIPTDSAYDLDKINPYI